MQFNNLKKLSDYYRRTIFNAVSIKKEDYEKPLIAIVNSWGKINPGHIHLDEIGREVEKGIIDSGGTPLEFFASGLCDGLSQGSKVDRYSLPYRDITAAFIESMVKVLMADAMVMLATCDKVVPAYLMAAARLDIPTILVTGGYMCPGEFKGRARVMTDIVEDFGKLSQNKIGEKEMEEAIDKTCIYPGACGLMGTANTDCCVAEALGMTLPYNSTTSAISKKIREIARTAGTNIISLLKEKIKPSDIMKKEAFLNAIKLTLAIGGSTNLIIHIPAIAQELGIELPLKLWDKFSKIIPLIVAIKPNHPDFTMLDLDKAGGLPSVLKNLSSYLNLEVKTVTGKTLEHNLKDLELKNNEVIRSVNNPHKKEGGLAVLYGNLALEGAIVKQSAVPENMLIFNGKAKVYNSEEDAIEGLLTGKVTAGDVIVIRYEGPKGGPGMRQMQFFLQILKGMELEEKVGLVTDGRFSGTNRGLAVGHISPEAYSGGIISVVEDGDDIEINIPERKILLKIDEKTIKTRKDKWKKIEKDTTPLLKLYQNNCSNVEQGAHI